MTLDFRAKFERFATTREKTVEDSLGADNKLLIELVRACVEIFKLGKFVLG